MSCAKNIRSLDENEALYRACLADILTNMTPKGAGGQFSGSQLSHARGRAFNKVVKGQDAAYRAARRLLIVEVT